MELLCYPPGPGARCLLNVSINVSLSSELVLVVPLMLCRAGTYRYVLFFWGQEDCPGSYHQLLGGRAAVFTGCFIRFAARVTIG